MKHNLMTKVVNDLSSRKCRKAGCYIGCGLGAIVVFSMVCTLLLSALTMDSEAPETAALESVKIDDSYEAEIDGLAVTVHVEGIGSRKSTDEAGSVVRKQSDGESEAAEPATTDIQAAYIEGERQILLASQGDPIVPQSESLGENDTEADELSADGSESESDSTESQIECLVQMVPEGSDEYKAMMAQLAEETGDADAVTQVMKMTAFNEDGQELKLSGCKVTAKVVPTRGLIDKVGNDETPVMMSMTVFPLGVSDEPEKKFFTNGEIKRAEENPEGEPLLPIDVTYTVPENSSAVFAVQSRAVGNSLVLEDNVELTGCIEVNVGEEFTIDLNGHTIKRENRLVTKTFKNGYVAENDYPITDEFFWVHSGGTLTVKDSGGGGVITSRIGEQEIGMWTLIRIVDDDPESDGGVVNIEGGTLENKNGINVIGAHTADVRGTVNVSGGTLTGAIDTGDFAS